MAKKVFLRVDDLIKAMENDADYGAKMLAEATLNYLKDKTIKNLYLEMPEGEYYERTGGLLKSISLSFRKSAYAIFFDGRSLKKRKATKTGYFNAHADFYQNQVAKDKLIDWIENGHPIPHTPEDRKGAHMISDTEKWLKKKIKDICAKSSLGISLSDAVKIVIK